MASYAQPSLGAVAVKTTSVVIAVTALSVLLTAIGAPLLFALTALAGLIVFVQFAAVYPAAALGIAIVGLGGGPFLWGFTSGVLPKVFVDEIVILLYLAAVPLLYLTIAKRHWYAGFGRLYLVLFVLVVAHALSFAMGSDLVAIRNFLETYVLGCLLLVLFLQEGLNTRPERVVPYIAGLTVFLAAFQVVEKAFEWNPLWKNVSDFVYLSPEVARATEGTYRPYATFFSPSEAGTFIAMGFPFVVWAARYSHSKAAKAGVVISLAGLAVNGTRGVWVAVAILAFGSMPHAFGVAIAAIPVLGLGGWVAYLALQSTAFVQRIADPNNLLIRFQYWRVAGQILKSHWVSGIGHMQFRKVYLDYVRDMSQSMDWDVRKIFVADNLYLTTVVEHGIIGLVSLLGVFYLGFRMLRRGRRALLQMGNPKMADFVRCAEFALGVYVISGFLADVELFTKVTKYVFLLTGLGIAGFYQYAYRDTEQRGDRSATTAYQKS